MILSAFCGIIPISVFLYYGELVGVVGADFTLDTITDIVNSIPYSKGEYGFLVDASGNYVIHENTAYLPGEDSATAVDAVSSAISGIVASPGCFEALDR